MWGWVERLTPSYGIVVENDAGEAMIVRQGDYYTGRWPGWKRVRKMAYDTKCYDLAAAFLEDEPAIDTEKNRRKLAQAIQDEIENWIACEREVITPAGSPPSPARRY